MTDVFRHNSPRSEHCHVCKLQVKLGANATAMHCSSSCSNRLLISLMPYEMNQAHNLRSPMEATSRSVRDVRTTQRIQNSVDPHLCNTVHTEGKSTALKQVSLLTVYTHKISAVSSRRVPLTSVSRRPAASPRFQAYVHPVTQHTHDNTAFALENPRANLQLRSLRA